MLFNSWQFLLVFLPVVLGVFLCLPAAWQNSRKGWLIVASFVFYAYWKIEYVPLLLASMAFNFGAAEGIIRWHGQRRGKLVLYAGVSGNLVLLGYYKYTDFFLQLFGRIADQPVPKFDLILPLAISFFTFTQIGYLVDVHRDQTKHYRLLDYVLFVVFFPHLIAGPIVRHWEIIPQFMSRWPRPSGKDLAVGMAIFLIGLFKKVLIADPLSEYADAAFAALQPGLTLTFFDAWFGTLAYALQIYFDFSGYSDMAIGLARLFAIKFPFNFDSPYKARSVVEFWQRWHVTLSRFLREYLYFSLGGNRCGPLRQKLNVMTTMVLSGLWHGAGITFVLWGALHGVYLVMAHGWQGTAKRMQSWQKHWSYGMAGWALTFLAVLV
ncbi:MAG: MBOAT family protein, partial [Opitutaceae bacterium]|nr:MBOAT family protein [Verrucomicrobiales bacterium]